MDSWRYPREVVIDVDLIHEHSGSFTMATPKSFSEEQIGRFEVLSSVTFLSYYFLLPGNAKEKSLKGIFGNSRQ